MPPMHPSLPSAFPFSASSRSCFWVRVCNHCNSSWGQPPLPSALPSHPQSYISEHTRPHFTPQKRLHPSASQPAISIPVLSQL